MLYIRNYHSVVGQLYFKNKKNSQKKRSDLWLPKVGSGGEGELDKDSQKGTNFQL